MTTNAQLQLRVQRYGWDRAVDYYDAGWEKALLPAQDLLISLAGPEPGEQVIDIACGTGLVGLRVAEKVGPGGSVLGTDISEQMLGRATALAARRGITNFSAQRMEAELLKCPDNRFGLALNALGLMYVTDAPGAIQEMHRVLRPGGRAVAAVWGSRSGCGWSEIFPIVDSRVNTDVCPLFFQLGTGDTLAKTFRAAGFREIGFQRINTTLYYPSAEAAISAVFAGGPVAMAYSRFDAQTKKEAHAEYLDSIEHYRRAKAYFIPGEFVVAFGSK